VVDNIYLPTSNATQDTIAILRKVQRDKGQGRDTGGTVPDDPSPEAGRAGHTPIGVSRVPPGAAS
jgi:hypothetical protein